MGFFYFIGVYFYRNKKPEIPIRTSGLYGGGNYFLG